MATQSTSRRWRHALLLLAVALVGASGALLVIEAVAIEGPPAQLSQSIPVGNARTGPEYKACVGGNEASARLALAVTAFNPHALTVTVSASLCVPRTLLTQLTYFNSQTGRPTRIARTQPLGDRLLAVPKYATAQFGVEYVANLPAPTTIPVDPRPSFLRHTSLKTLLGLGRLNESTSPVVPLGDFVLPVASGTGRYPFDWYGVLGDLSVPSLSQFIALPPDLDNLLPYELTVLADPSIAPFVVHASMQTTYATSRANFVGITLERKTVTRWYVVVVACIPLILGLLLALVLFAQDRPPSGRIGPESIAGVAAVLLAILPIRLVLVPAEVSELTLVDYWLGFEMASLAAMACVAVWRALGASIAPGS